VSDTTETPSPWLNNKQYDFIKFLALIVLPLIATVYFGLSQIWGLPKGAEVVGTITLIDTALGALIAKSSLQYDADSAGTLAITGYNQITGHPDLALTLDPTKINAELGKVQLKVDKLTDEVPPPLPPPVSDEL
jgi:hypothetical protein